ncbi:MAG: SDR family NAD(P)-dependent oxidoreductase [Clostridia bacterium]
MEKYAVVTGADRGLGYAFTEELLKRNFTVFAGQFMPQWPDLENLKDQYKEKLILLDLDISSDISVKNACYKIRKMCPYINLLINNAGITGDVDLKLGDDLDFDKMLRLYNTNTLGALRMVNGLYDYVLLSENKLIITISSEAASIQNCWRVNDLGYAMSKTAVNMQGAIIHNSIKNEGGKQVLIHPGWLQSYMKGQLSLLGKQTPTESAQAILKTYLDKEIPCTEKPIYKDFRENDLPW